MKNVFEFGSFGAVEFLWIHWDKSEHRRAESAKAGLEPTFQRSELT